jgi:hypothetical protein
MVQITFIIYVMSKYIVGAGGRDTSRNLSWISTSWEREGEILPGPIRDKYIVGAGGRDTSRNLSWIRKPSKKSIHSFFNL